MEDLVPSLLAGLGGVFLGGLVTARIGSWARAISDAQKSEPRTSVPLAVVLHSTPWLIGAIACWAYLMLSNPHATAWFWFFLSTGSVPVVVIPTAVAIYLRKRAAKTDDKGNASAA